MTRFCKLSFVLLVLAVTPAVAQLSPKMLVDFENSTAVKRIENQARTQIVHDAGGRSLQVVTDASAAYPGVNLSLPEGIWDVAAFDAVEMDVRNPQDVPLRVLLSLNNRGSNGVQGCNTESVSVPARGSGKVVVPKGVWHGESGHNIDWSKIVSMHVMLDRPGRSHTFIVDNIRAVSQNRVTIEQAMQDPFFLQLKPGFGRGINLGNALDAPKEGAWGVTLREEYFDLIASAGFNSVRVPIRWSAHADTSRPYRIEPEFFQRVDWVVSNCLSRRLIPIINVHHYGELMDAPLEHRERFLALWSQIAEHYKDHPAALCFELLNEPNGNLNATTWNALLADAIKTVRRTNPTRKLVVGPAEWNSLRQLDSLELPEDDRNLIVTFHYYSPMKFTHQGAGWVGSQANAWLGTTWTGTPEEKEAVTLDLDRAITWAVQHRRPMYLGEFGAYSKADMQSRARWTRFVAQEALRRKISFAYWEFCAGFGVYDPGQGKWIEPLREALLKEK